LAGLGAPVLGEVVHRAHDHLAEVVVGEDSDEAAVDLDGVDGSSCR
jgi:hypothetical protein